MLRNRLNDLCRRGGEAGRTILRLSISQFDPNRASPLIDIASQKRTFNISATGDSMPMNAH